MLGMQCDWWCASWKEEERVAVAQHRATLKQKQAPPPPGRSLWGAGGAPGALVAIKGEAVDDGAVQVDGRWGILGSRGVAAGGPPGKCRGR